MFLFPLIYSCFIFFIPIINAQSSYAPNGLRLAEHGTLIDNKIIFFDSADFGINNTNAFSLDLSVNWTTSAPAFTKIDNLSNAPTFNYAAFSALKKNDRSLIYAFGGLIPTNNSDWTKGTPVSDFYKIDVTSYPISISSVSGNTPSARWALNSIFDDNGKLYIWGGETLATDQTMYIFDTFDSKWSQILPSYVPAQRSQYSVTFNDDKLYFIGGVFANTTGQKCVDIREILIYDTLNTENPWTIKNATNNTSISNRYAHSAALEPNRLNIILYGGSKSNDSGVPPDYLITLHLQTFEFSEIITPNKPSIEDSRLLHHHHHVDPNFLADGGSNSITLNLLFEQTLEPIYHLMLISNG
ncbi:10153_t:CDS:2 [Ambispora gerdemannii]|uniref:10153_t:CDS:1 n=1 Tax=Ambispora gerdemannii TaxID=144530 RepID=A0A9N9G6F6_9GLOM|nr:10153_t:CDS:2 [Ambispora gerdemannii]